MVQRTMIMVLCGAIFSTTVHGAFVVKYAKHKIQQRREKQAMERIGRQLEKISLGRHQELASFEKRMTADDPHYEIAQQFRKIVRGGPGFEQKQSPQEKCAQLATLICDGFDVNRGFSALYDDMRTEDTYPLAYICNFSHCEPDLFYYCHDKDYAPEIVSLARLLCLHGADVNKGAPLWKIFSHMHTEIKTWSNPCRVQDMPNACMLVALLLEYGADTSQNIETLLSMQGVIEKNSDFQSLIAAYQVYRGKVRQKDVATLQSYFPCSFPLDLVSVVYGYVESKANVQLPVNLQNSDQVSLFLHLLTTGSFPAADKKNFLGKR